MGIRFYARHIFYDLLVYFIEDARSIGNEALAILKVIANIPLKVTEEYKDFSNFCKNISRIEMKA